MISYSLHRSIKSRITQKRERNTTVTLFLVCFCYFLFVGPMVLLQILSTIFNNFLNQTVYLSIYCIYWFQYSFNFMIYVIRGEQYRKAYMFFLTQVLLTLDNIHLLSQCQLYNALKLLQIKVYICGSRSSSISFGTSSIGHVQNMYTKNIFNIQTSGSTHVKFLFILKNLL